MEIKLSEPFLDKSELIKEPSHSPLARNLFNLEEKELEQVTSVSLFQIFRFATKLDILYMILGSLCSIGNGLIFPIYSILFGKMTNELIKAENIMESAKNFAILYLIIGFIGFFLSFGGLSLWMMTGERQNIRLREEYFKALLRQDISWFDTINPTQMTTKFSNDTTFVQSLLGEKISTLFYILTMTFSGYIIGLIWNYKLTLILLISTIPIIISGVLVSWSFGKGLRKISAAYEKSGGFAEQAFGAIRTVVGLTGEQREIRNYESELGETKKTAVFWGTIIGFALGFMFFSMIGEYGLGLYYGSIMIENQEEIQTGDILGVFFAVTSGTFSLGSLTPVIKASSEAKRAINRIIWLIDRVPPINYQNKHKKILNSETLEGEITFENVVFAYPMRNKLNVLDNINLMFKKGTKTALVGKSGCGKSTCIQLIERFYDPIYGKICLDGVDLRDIQLESLRNNIGYVGQEPFLFATTIIENLRYGKLDASNEEVVEAAKQANAYEFISKLEKGFETFVGHGGTQLSGGQKQRLAIARAILKNPKILLFDEATSALDHKNELEIQNTLEMLSKGRTTIVVAHRLSTIQNADLILVLDDGKIIETGTHQQLLNLKSFYFNMIKNQLIIESCEEMHEKNDNNNFYEENPAIQLEKSFQTDEFFPVLPEKENEYNSNPFQKSESATENYACLNEGNKIKSDSVKIYSKWMIIKRLFYFKNLEIFLLFTVLTLSSLIDGAINSGISIIFVEMLEILNNPNSAGFRSESNFLCIIFLIFAGVNFGSRFFSIWAALVSAAAISFDLRKKLFKKLLSLPISFFDDFKNSAGTLATHLQEDVELINDFATSILGLILEAASSLVIGIIISFYYSWEITICIVFTTPLLLYCSKLQEEINEGFSIENSKAYKQSAGVIAECVNNMRTLSSFGPTKALQTYKKILKTVKKKLITKAINSGIIYGTSVFLTFAINALSYYIGMLFMKKGEITFKDMYCSIFALMFAATSAGSSSQYIPNLGKAMNSAQNIFKILDISSLNVNSNTSLKDLKSIKGDIEFVNVSFKYPTREKQIFKNLNFKISAGKKIAFVGASGCGKSTIIGLLLRFYDVDEGAILLDGINIKEYNLYFLRRLFGLVSQEPVLFNGTIEYNLKYIREDATDEEMKEAAQNANALDFIEKNEFESMLDEKYRNYGSGFQRLVGPKGSQISGGQKQRIAIARAIINKPKILLLDEATSALDAQNEKIVQESLDNIMHGYTSIVIAHRLSTIKDADEIFVFKDGNIVEKGVFEELIEKKGEFRIFYGVE